MTSSIHCFIEPTTSKIALRFWTANVEDAQKRYQIIDTYLKKKKLPYFVGFNFHVDELRWNNEKYPFISMEWVEGYTLGKYIEKNINKSSKILQVADSFLDMVKELHQHDIAHGDLQDGNILVIENGNDIVLKLIDYDSVFVPGLESYSLEIIGVEAYQHPNKKDCKTMDKTIDYFSELVIYLSLLAYAEDSTLWKSGQDQQLLFDTKDFKDTYNSTIISQLKTHYSPVVQELTNKLVQFCEEDNISNLVPLEDRIKNEFNDILDFISNIKSKVEIPYKQVVDDGIEEDLDKVKRIFGSISKGNLEVQSIDSNVFDTQFSEALNNMRG